ncbi:hypothetical protein Q9R19_10030 [Microbacterium sp. ARD32]|uniref:hypothetical protein n=1 Tax=Microbacterium sp. ARD32 TaxID=2962577 RepID=UPI002882AC60|nr:hypothetical protein [Microbacterium sp. ARD32]MDT0157960.1 hypothetical protein [Microbacterium sp. ARD32]
MRMLDDMDTILGAQAARRTDTAASTARALADGACAAAGIRLVPADDAAACERVLQVMGRIWGWERPQFETPVAVALAHGGNLIAVVETADGEPIGATMGMCGPPGRPFHSHIVGLLPAATGRGVGRAVKLAQRAWCLERGIETMTWTFDPLVARNAFFNIRRLGALPVEYLPDFYGPMTDAINAGQGSDRLLVEWDLTAAPPSATRPEPAVPGAATVVADVAGAASDYLPPHDDAPLALISVPGDIEGIRHDDPARAQRWREQTRRALGDLTSRGWTVDGLARRDRTGVQYVLRRREPQ